MRISDRHSGLFLVALGTVAAYGGSRLPPVPGQQIGPNVFPLVVGIGLAVCGLMIALGIGHKFEEEAEADLAAHSDAAPAAARSRWNGLLALLPPGLLLFYVYASEWLGFVPTAFAIVLAMARALGAGWRLALPLALVVPVVVHFLFAKLLRVPLPFGFLPMPW
ncbi:MAG: tripartite tricarboxylate transporter TctB family protein [Rhodospirillales bacterium]|nr:tripartite tricarboxylate transporter TctB family protein [Rhodospirillales bacterium]